MPKQGSVSFGFQSPPMMPQSSIFTPPTLRFTHYPGSAANRNFQFTSAGGGKDRMTGALTWPACRRACSGTTPRRCDRPAPGTGSPRPPAQGEWVGIEGRGLGLGRAVAPPAAAAGKAGQRITPGATCANFRVPRAVRSQQLNNISLSAAATSPHTRRRRLLATRGRKKRSGEDRARTCEELG
jgi:hypothetical protein